MKNQGIALASLTNSQRELPYGEKSSPVENFMNKIKVGKELSNELILLASLTTETKFSNQYKGILFKFSGRLKGSQRDKKMQLYNGRISTQTFRSSINFSKKQIFTK
jgi:hypothetical protein